MELDRFLELLKYQKTGNKYVKDYNGYKITVDESFKVDYGNKIQKDRSTTTNLAHQDETKVVFQCIDRLLTLGYNPKAIYLEKSFSSGRSEHGQFLDILVNDKKGKAFMMIECKTPDTFNDEIDNMQDNGGQLFTYFKNDRAAKYLCLYTSSFDENEKLLYLSQIVKTNDLKGTNKEELFDSWDKTFENKGIFEDGATPYSIEFHGITKKELKYFSDFDIGIKGENGTFFNRFREILRHNSISDKNNAYNKIFNLFLCKIVDEEERQDDEEMWFQWKDCESAEDVLSRLNDLYKRGMDKYLELEISDFSEKELDDLLDSDGSTNDEIRAMFRQLRLYKNNEFAFLEVINERTFKENAKVVKEVVKLLESYKIKMSSKMQFLGDFFEKLLSIGVKQESGQFFTPIPIANFIVNSIPVEKIISDKIANHDEDFLPYLIDYACGGGHFLTEGMHRIDKVVKKLKEDELKTTTQKNNLSRWQKDYYWAGNFVYGVELDYRLAKTTKVACFLNGDGDANIMYANGIDPFTSSNYRGKLLSSDKQKNENFDVVVANPPYSVKEFLKNVEEPSESFTLFNFLTKKTDDIETLFVERTWQLLREGGYCGIILPDTILISASPEVFIETRKLILTYFDIVGITHLGEQTFIATGTSTIVLFAKKRKTALVTLTKAKAKSAIDKSIENGLLDDEKLRNYYDSVYKNEGVSEENYLEYIRNNSSAKSKEIEQFYIWMLNQNVNVIVASTGKRIEEIEFLGYKHTDKKNYEGIRPYPDNDENIIRSRLYTDGDVGDQDKVSYYIYQNFLGNICSKEDLVNHNLDRNVRIEAINDLIAFNSETKEFDDKNYSYMVITKEVKPIHYDTFLFNSVKLGQLIGDDNIGTGGKAPKSRYFVTDEEKDCVFIRAKHLNNAVNNFIVLKDDNYFALDNPSRSLVNPGTILFPKSGQSVNTNNIAMVSDSCYVVNHLATVWCADNNTRLYVYYLLKHYKTSSLKLSDTGYPTIRMSTIRKMEIPFPKEEKLLSDIVFELEGVKRDGASKEKIWNEEEKILKKYSLIYEDND